MIKPLKKILTVARAFRMTYSTRAAFTGFAEQLLRQDVEMGAVL